MVTGLEGLIQPVNDQTISGKWMHFIGSPDNLFMVESPDLFTDRKIELLKIAHKKAIKVYTSPDDYARSIKKSLLEL